MKRTRSVLFLATLAVLAGCASRGEPKMQTDLWRVPAVTTTN
jgi:type IV pilus biogenesis protein CpaD/CtpE